MSKRWRIFETKTQFRVACERPSAHIEVNYGDHKHNIPHYGTKDQARADAECIVAALNARDCPDTDYSLADPSTMPLEDRE